MAPGADAGAGRLRRPLTSPPAASTSPRRSTSSRGCCSPPSSASSPTASPACGSAARRASPGPAAAALLLVGALAGATLLAPPARAADDAPISTRDADGRAPDPSRLCRDRRRDVDETTRLGLETLARVLGQRTSAQIAEPIARRSGARRTELLSADLLAGRRRAAAAAARRGRAHRRLHEERRHGRVRHPRRAEPAPRRPADAGRPVAAHAARRRRRARARAGAARPRRHQDLLSHRPLSSAAPRDGQTWIEALPPPDPNDRTPRPARAGDSVSPIVITSNDLAAAWAVRRRSGRPLYPLIPGGPRQRELALRGGVNLVMYTLTGSYKADQVHAKDLLERLSH